MPSVIPTFNLSLVNGDAWDASQVDLVEAAINALPRGVVASASKTATQATITTVVDISTLTVTFTALAGRRYKIHAEGAIASTVADDVAQLQITNSANTVQVMALGVCRVAGFGVRMACEIDVVPGAGSITYKVRALRSAGTGSLTFDAAATYPGFIRVEDIGT